MKIVLLHNEIKPFRLPLFNYLNSIYDVKIYCLRSNKLTENNIKDVEYGRYIRIPKMQDLEIPLDLWFFLKNEKPDVIISTDLGYAITYIGYLYSRVNQCKFVLWNEQWSDILHPRRYLTKPLERLICRKADKILSFGYKHAEYLIQLGAKENNISIVPNAVPDFYPLSKSHNENNEFFNIPWIHDVTKIKIVCPGRLVKIKGHETILNSAVGIIKANKNARFIFAGSGPEFGQLQQMVNKLGLNDYVFITGVTFNEEMKNALLINADLVILASVKSKKIRAVEAWGLVVNEAIQYKKKIIVSDATGVANELIIDNETGGVFENGNHIDLQNKILSCINHPEQWNIYAEKAYEKLITDYSMDVLIKKITFALEEI